MISWEASVWTSKSVTFYRFYARLWLEAIWHNKMSLFVWFEHFLDFLGKNSFIFFVAFLENFRHGKFILKLTDLYVSCWPRVCIFKSLLRLLRRKLKVLFSTIPNWPKLYCLTMLQLISNNYNLWKFFGHNLLWSFLMSELTNSIILRSKAKALQFLGGCWYCVIHIL